MKLVPEYNIKTTLPTSATGENITGSAYASHTGTPNKYGIWRAVCVDEGATVKYFSVSEIESYSDSRIVPVLPGGTSTLIVDGVTVTLGSTINIGDTFDIRFTRLKQVKS